MKVKQYAEVHYLCNNDKAAITLICYDNQTEKHIIETAVDVLLVRYFKAYCNEDVPFHDTEVCSNFKIARRYPVDKEKRNNANIAIHD
ncbi:hypothetical protein [Candidatus Albibeggiatoa sp. nov. BB20]|uniref:hypothetical protein n=1 Tax=Candidatus Albibeggiatoa sp. nov. BB20 TaxID=3162723 RepID=UPI0033654B04